MRDCGLWRGMEDRQSASYSARPSHCFGGQATRAAQFERASISVLPVFHLAAFQTGLHHRRPCDRGFVAVASCAETFFAGMFSGRSVHRLWVHFLGPRTQGGGRSSASSSGSGRMGFYLRSHMPTTLPAILRRIRTLSARLTRLLCQELHRLVRLRALDFLALVLDIAGIRSCRFTEPGTASCAPVTGLIRCTSMARSIETIRSCESYQRPTILCSHGDFPREQCPFAPRANGVWKPRAVAGGVVLVSAGRILTLRLPPDFSTLKRSMIEKEYLRLCIAIAPILRNGRARALLRTRRPLSGFTVPIRGVCRRPYGCCCGASNLYASKLKRRSGLTCRLISQNTDFDRNRTETIMAAEVDRVSARRGRILSRGEGIEIMARF